MTKCPHCDATVLTAAPLRGREVPLPLWVGGEDPLPRCEHGNCLRDGGGEILEPSCGCRGRAAPLRGRDYSAWLIEMSEPEGPEYFQLVDDDNWSSDHDTALHFARKQDAEKYIADVGWTRARAVEHMWPTSPPEQPAAAPVTEGK